MIPTNFGDLPSNALAPIAKAEINRGADYGSYSIDNASAGAFLPDNYTNGYRVVRTLVRPAFLVAEFSTLIQGQRAQWDYAQLAITITPADLDGVSEGNYLMAPLNSAVPPRTFSTMYPFRCGPGTYTVFAKLTTAPAAFWYWIYRVYSRLTVDVVGDGVT